MATYPSGQLVTLSCNFTVSGVPTDPTTVVFKIRRGTATVTSFVYPGDTALVRDGTGVYHVDFVPTVSGTYYYRFQGFTACQAAGEGSFDCAATRF